MAKQTINYGTAAGDGTGENLFNAFKKTNENFDELYGAKTEFYANSAAFPATGDATRIYVAADTGVAWRWTGSVYQAVGWDSTGTKVTRPDGVSCAALPLDANGNPKKWTGSYSNFPSYLNFVDDTSPTLFFDPTYTGGIGSGTTDLNPCRTWVEVHAAIAAITANGRVPNTVLGIKTGINWRMNTQGNPIRLASVAAGSAGSTQIVAGGTFAGYFRIVPYGSSSDLPILNGAMILTGWTNEGGGIYSRDMSVENPGTALSLPLWEAGVRLKKSGVDGRTRAETLTDLAAAGPGYYYSCLASEKRLYVYPNDVGSLESGDMETTGVSRCLNLLYPDVRMTGFISVSGIEAKGALDTWCRIEPKATTNLLAVPANGSISDIIVKGCKQSMIGADTNLSQGSCDGLIIVGATDAVRARNVYIAGIKSDDLINNAVETSAIDGMVVEWIDSSNASGKLLELWSSNSNTELRNSRCLNHTAQYNKATNFGKAAGWWAAPNNYDGGAADGTHSNNNTVHHCILHADAPIIAEAGSGNLAHHNTVKTVLGALGGAGITMGGTCTGLDVSNNLVIQGNAHPQVWVKTGATGLTGDNNVYVFNGRPGNAALWTHSTSTNIAGLSAGDNAISWYEAKDRWTAALATAGHTAAATFDLHSVVVNGMPDLDDDWVPSAPHPAVGAGKTGLGYAMDIYGNFYKGRPAAGACEPKIPY